MANDGLTLIDAGYPGASRSCRPLRKGRGHVACLKSSERGYVSWPRGLGTAGDFAPEFQCQRQQNFEAEAVTPLFHGLEIRTSVVIVIFLTLGT